MDRVISTWYCARTKPKHEHIAAAYLTNNLGLEVFHPRLKLERVTRRGVVRLVEPLFPCYIFVRGMAADRLDEVRYVTGISSLVHFGTQIATVPAHVIEELKECFEQNEPLCVEDSLSAGSEVTVAEGAFQGSRGIVVRVFPAKQRIMILVDFLGRTTMAELDRKSIFLENSCVADLVPSLARRRPECVAAPQFKSTPIRTQAVA